MKMQNFKNGIKLSVFKKVLDTLPNSIYIKDINGRYIWLNKTAMERLQYKHLVSDSILGKTDFEVFPKKDAKNYVENDKLVLETKKGVCVEEEVLVPDGRKLTQLSFKEPLYDEKSSELIGVLGYSIDITDRKEAEEKLKVALTNERMTKKAKKSFLENMCHDFRTPFSGLLGLTQTLMNRESNKKKKELLGIIAKSAEILLNDLNEIFNFLKLENGIPVLMKQFALADVFHDISATSLPKAKEKNLEFKFTLDKKVPTYLIGDKFRTKRILENLVSNALKFTDYGEVVLKVELAKDLDKKLIVKFTIQDT